MGTTYRMPTLTSRREYFRLPYPVTSGAVLTVDGVDYKVEEISERGLRIAGTAEPLAVDAPVEGTLLLTVGQRCTVSGKVLRVEANVTVVRLEKGLAWTDVVREQRHLAKTYPEWKPQP